MNQSSYQLRLQHHRWNIRTEVLIIITRSASDPSGSRWNALLVAYSLSQLKAFTVSLQEKDKQVEFCISFMPLLETRRLGGG